MTMSVGEQVRWWSVGFAVFIAFLWVFSNVLTPFLAGAAMAYFLDPLADRLEAKGLSRALATVIISTVAFGGVSALLIMIVPEAFAQLRDLIEALPGYAQAVREFVFERYPHLFEEGSAFDTAAQAIKENISQWSSTLLERAWSSGLAIIDFLSLLVITPVVAFYLLLDWDHLVARVDQWAPRDHLPVVRKLARDIDSVLAGFVRGQLSVCAILGLFYAAALMLIGLDFGLLVGLFAGLLSFIPFVGALMGGAASIGLAIAQFWGEWGMIAAVAVVFGIGQVAEGNYLTPKLVGGSVGLHPVALMFALSAFGALLGFTGLLIAVPAAACIGVLGRFALDQYTSGRLYRGYSAPEDDADGGPVDRDAPPPPSDRRFGA
ncbi:AI-2E family transporter [Rhodovulum sp. DZ06]|uniref:AI-2E family transporter n=1 Tax=Rhodovulum sp. DZ06 TaxID=3425126 RepID=UPI003D35235E